ncbi:uncharacterized protein LOC135384354 [Ornithodoros turicata]|uniref:uncharacterized protein LOC135384354 n=1 Tax=Ornithodoros turicata TaxID=34597 RepID=UPI0031398561
MIQRHRGYNGWISRLQKYDLRLEHIPRKDLVIADTLSRAPLQSVTITTMEQTPKQATLAVLVTASSNVLDRIRRATIEDERLQTVNAYCRNGWPPSRRRLSQELQPYWGCHDQLYFEQGLLCRGMRLVIPDKYRKYAFDKLHVGYCGMTACKSRARESLYWPNMTQNIEQMVCECQSFQRPNSEEPLLKVPLSSLPRQKLGIDFFHVSGQRYLIVIDCFSKYVELQLMNTTNSQAVVKALKKVYARFGIPFEFVTDNGPPFDSEAFAQFNQD